MAQKAPVKKTDLAKQSVLTSVQANAGNEVSNLNFVPQNNLPKATSNRQTRAFEEFTTMTTGYDLQSNSAIGNRIALWNDGTAAVVATWDNSGNTSYPNRGTGYNYYDGSSFGDEPSVRVESMRSGWPSIAPLGDGEILASHATGTNIHTRATKGTGDWTLAHNFADWTWPRIATTGANQQTVHVIFGDQDASNTLLNYVAYSKSTDGGQTWSDPANPPLVDIAADYNNMIGADDYVMATNGDNIAILFGSLTYDIFYVISHDGGETWEKQIVAQHPYQHFDWNQTAVTSATDSIWWEDNSHSIAIDDNGTVHVAFGLTRWAPAPESGAGYYTYWPYTIGIVYWNSEYVNEQGGHEIPVFGQFSQDASHAEWQLNGTNGCSSMLNEDRLMLLAEADGQEHLHVFGWPDETGDGTYDVSANFDNRPGSYRTQGIATLPGISIDENGNIAIIYNVLSESRIDATTNYYFRSAYMTYRDNSNAWFDDVENLTGDFIHSLDEVYSTTACPNAQNGSFWVAYSADQTIGLVLDTDSGQTTITDNIIYAVKVTPDCAGWNVNEAVNPVTSLSVRPNPAQNVLYLDVNASQASEMNATVYNVVGQKVIDQNLSALSTGINTRSLDITNLNSGIYILTVSANGYTETQKFIVK